MFEVFDNKCRTLSMLSIGSYAWFRLRRTLKVEESVMASQILTPVCERGFSVSCILKPMTPEAIRFLTI